MAARTTSPWIPTRSMKSTSTTMATRRRPHLPVQVHQHARATAPASRSTSAARRSPSRCARRADRQTQRANLNESRKLTPSPRSSGDRRTGTRAAVTNAAGGATSFGKPLDNVGNKTIPNYASYAGAVHPLLTIPGCATPGRVFVGQRAEAFAVNLGEIFDLVNFVPIERAPAMAAASPAASRNRAPMTTWSANPTSPRIALELPISCITGAGNGVIGGWTTASLPQAQLNDPTPTYEPPRLHGGAYVQMSRLSNAAGQRAGDRPARTRTCSTPPSPPGRRAVCGLRHQPDLAGHPQRCCSATPVNAHRPAAANLHQPRADTTSRGSTWSRLPHRLHRHQPAPPVTCPPR